MYVEHTLDEIRDPVLGESSISPPANGATRPNSATRNPSGPDSSPIDQPRSFEIGVSGTPGTLIAALEHMP